LHASRQTVLTRACLAGGLAALAGLPYALFLFGYAVWILQKISNLFRVNLYTQLQELSLSFHSEEKIGDALFRTFQDSAGIPHVINGLLLRPLQAVPSGLANFGWLVVFNYRMALIALILILAEISLALIFSAPLRSAFLDAREATALAITRIEETLASIKAVKAFGRERHEATLYADENWAAMLAERKARMLLLFYNVASNFIRSLAYLAVLYIGARQVVLGEAGGLAGSAVSLGLFQGTLIAFNRIAGSGHQLAMIWGSLQDVGVGFARVFQILGKQPDRIAGTPHVPDNHVHDGSLKNLLAFDHVSFGYVPEVPVLNEISFEARVGELTAIAGPSGAGKSTMIALLLRFFDPAEGRILVDGGDISEFDLDIWRKTVAVALQDNPLLTGTLRSNIAYGRPDAPAEQIRAAIQRVELGELVDSLPMGLDTLVGERGARLSAGERQRIGVARALLRDAPILLLDEPSSALDIATEATLMSGLREWLAERPAQRLIIMMTHRRTALDWADRVYRIADGRLAEQSHWRVGAATSAGHV
jgi:ABC-type multidrug transport system fused ATPase/permease subunit